MKWGGGVRPRAGGGDIKQDRKQWMKQAPAKVRLSTVLNKEVGISIPAAD